MKQYIVVCVQHEPGEPSEVTPSVWLYKSIEKAKADILLPLIWKNHPNGCLVADTPDELGVGYREYFIREVKDHEVSDLPD